METAIERLKGNEELGHTNLREADMICSICGFPINVILASDGYALAILAMQTLWMMVAVVEVAICM